MEEREVITALKNQEPTMLVDFVKVSKNAICAGSTKHLRKQPAVYVLWWVKEPVQLIDAWQAIKKQDCTSLLNTDFTNYDGSITPIPLFIDGTDNLSHRLSQHMKLGVQGRFMDKLSNRTISSSTVTNHQLRLGIEEIFPDVKDSRQLIFDHVGLTYLLARELVPLKWVKNENDLLQKKLCPLFIHKNVY